MTNEHHNSPSASIAVACKRLANSIEYSCGVISTLVWLRRRWLEERWNAHRYWPSECAVPSVRILIGAEFVAKVPNLIFVATGQCSNSRGSRIWGVAVRLAIKNPGLLTALFACTSFLRLSTQYFRECSAAWIGGIISSPIDLIDRIVPRIHVKVDLTSAEADGILTCPPPHARVVIPRSEPDEPRVRIVEPSRESKRDAHVPSRGTGQAFGLVSKFVVAHGLDDVAIRDVDDESWASQAVAQDAEGAQRGP